MSEYTIAKEIRSQTKVGAWIYAFDFMFLVLYALTAYLFKSFVNEHLIIPYVIFNAVMALILTSPSRLNRRRRMYQSVFIFLSRDDTLFRPIIHQYTRRDKR